MLLAQRLLLQPSMDASTTNDTIYDQKYQVDSPSISRVPFRVTFRRTSVETTGMGVCLSNYALVPRPGERLDGEFMHTFKVKRSTGY